MGSFCAGGIQSPNLSLETGDNHMAQFMVVIMVIWIGSAIPMLADDTIETNYGVSASSLLGPPAL